MQHPSFQQTLRYYGSVQGAVSLLRRDPRAQSLLGPRDSRKSHLRFSSGGFDTLQLAFESTRLRTICESEGQAKSELPAAVVEILKHRLADLRVAQSPRDLVAGRPRVLDGARPQPMILDLCDGWRMVFSANHPSNPVTEAGNLDWARVSRIKILRIESENG
jgi:proteic killer suppression protein